MKKKFRSGVENKVYLVLVFSIFIVFAVFFTSKEWLYDDSPIRHTPFNTTIPKLNQTDIEIENWQFNKDKSFMEIQIRKKHDISKNVKPTLNIQAYNYENNKEIKTVKAFEKDELLLVRLHDVDEDIRFIDLKIEEIQGEDDIKVEGNNINDEEKDIEVSVEDNEDKKSSVVLFGDYREIKTNNKLEERDEIGYETMFVENDIKSVEKEIKDINEEQIPSIDKRIVSLEEGIESIESEIEYTTGEEKSKLESDIQGNKNKIESSIEEKEKLKESIEEKQEKIKKYEEKLEDLQ